MSDDPFAALDEQAAGEPVDDEDTSDSTTTEPDTDEDEKEQGGPAFPFDETKHRGVYPRHSTWDSFVDSFDVEIKPRLISEYSIRDAEKREWHDAVLQLAMDNPEEVVERIVEAREDT
ncbi:hypothetical protein ACH9L7_20365 (plasmid) [Haloferax sp. S1W]|uniref:hypothetical protein n=1 Tax=Haloferax sp. S1W TaxID=3377110 RepID=UPI0037C77491